MIINPDDFDPLIGALQPVDVQFSAWSASENSYVANMFEITIENANGSSIGSMMYTLDGYQPDPLMGDRDAEELGFIKFHPTGKKPTNEGTLKRIPKKLHENLSESRHPT